MKLFKLIRIVFLLLILFAVAFYTKNQKLQSRSWAHPLQIVIYPMNGDNNNPVVDEYIRHLDESMFSDIDVFFQRESQKYSLITQHPTEVHLGSVLTEHPPTEPELGSSMLDLVGWSLKFRFWAFNHTPDSKDNAHRVAVFLYYHQDERNRVLRHSLGLDKGLLTIVHAFASKQQASQNNIIIAHEVLHTVGATDKYDAFNEPVFPNGYAQPDKNPLYPQTQAEIMSGHIPLSNSESRMADSLQQCVVGKQTALEINWIKS